eukprot:271754-Chlamydomonas_euryale.AAC.6
MKLTLKFVEECAYACLDTGVAHSSSSACMHATPMHHAPCTTHGLRKGRLVCRTWRPHCWPPNVHFWSCRSYSCACASTTRRGCSCAARRARRKRVPLWSRWAPSARPHMQHIRTRSTTTHSVRHALSLSLPRPFQRVAPTHGLRCNQFRISIHLTVALFWTGMYLPDGAGAHLGKELRTAWTATHCDCDRPLARCFCQPRSPYALRVPNTAA